MLAGSMSSLTAMTILPQFDCSVAAPLQPAPDLGARRTGGELQEDHRPQIGQPLVHDDAADALDAEICCFRCARNNGS